MKRPLRYTFESSVIFKKMSTTTTTSMCVGCDAIGRMFCEVCLNEHRRNMLNREYKLDHDAAIQREIDAIVERYEAAVFEPREEEPEKEITEAELEEARLRLLEIGRRVKRQTTQCRGLDGETVFNGNPNGERLMIEPDNEL